MSKVIPKRSIGGCLTCKRRKKKCDESRPFCRRCELGDFDCLGYNPPDASYAGDTTKAELLPRCLDDPVTQFRTEYLNLESLDALIPLAECDHEVQRPTPTDVLLREVRNCLSDLPQGIRLDLTVLEDMTSLIMTQYVKLSQEFVFKAPLIPLEQGLLRRMSDSDIVRWSMYLGARVIADFLHGGNVQKYFEWILRFCQQITETITPNEPGSRLEGRLGGLYDLMRLGSLISGTMAGYSLLQRSTPIFLRLAALEPNIWVDDSRISIAEAFRNSRYDIIQFISHDTITALMLSLPPLIQYDTTSLWIDGARGHYMEWVHGIAIAHLIIVAKINAWRASRMMGETIQSQNECHNTERRLNNWCPIMDDVDEPCNNIARYAIQEAWRQATLIYLYMGMCEVNSADPRVERAVQQVVQLGSTIRPGNQLEVHLLVPSLIAGVAARREKHRAALRGKIVGGLRWKTNPMVLPARGSDFVAVLDHLWHGVGSGGQPVTWDDYAQSRCTVLPVM